MYNCGMTIFHFLLYLVVSAVCAGIASRVSLGGSSFAPNGFLASAVVGIVGAWLGTVFLGEIGPSLEGVRLVPALVGSFACVSLLSLVGGLGARFSKAGKKNAAKVVKKAS